MSRVKLISPAGTQASLGIYGEGVDFDSISQRLGTHPSHSHRKGDPGMTSTPYPDDLWLLESPHLATESLDVHLNWLGQTFSPHYDFLRTLMVRHGVRSYCGISVDGDSCRFVIPPEALRIFVELGINMSLGLVFMGYSDLDTPSIQTAGVSQRQKTSASFELIGTDIDVNAISGVLGLAPSDAHRFGQPDPSGKPYPSSRWSIMATPSSGTDDLDAHLRWLSNVLSRHSDFLRSLMGAADFLVRCNFITETDTGGLEISPEALKPLVDLNISMDFSAYLVW
jgi:hypothetical protein